MAPPGSFLILHPALLTIHYLPPPDPLFPSTTGKTLGIHAVWTDTRVFGNWPCFIFLSLRSSVHSPGSGFFFFALVTPGWTSSSLLRSFLLGWPLYPFGSDEFRQAEVGCGDHWGKHLISW